RGHLSCQLHLEYAQLSQREERLLATLPPRRALERDNPQSKVDAALTSDFKPASDDILQVGFGQELIKRDGADRFESIYAIIQLFEPTLDTGELRHPNSLPRSVQRSTAASRAARRSSGS